MNLPNDEPFWLDETMIKVSEVLAGWGLYVTNAPTTQLSLPQAVMYYRSGMTFRARFSPLDSL
ncbi:MAG: hypothetical protein PUP92_21600 [Rhizonema sp. PD38]|nr:hypothetical protein [Rhizonema sp. PD38]